MMYVPPVGQIRRRLPAAAVLEANDLAPDPQGRYLCPFHDDRRTPNLVCLPPTDDHPYHGYFCNACGARGDSLDLITRLDAVSFQRALVLASELLEELPERMPKRCFPAHESPTRAWEQRLAEHQERAIDNAEHGLLSYAAEFPNSSPELDMHLIETYGWGLTEGADVAIPHRAPDGELTAVKVRTRDPSRRKWRCHGELPYLYGSWTSTDATVAILTEGESDAAHATFEFPDVAVRALPAGAGSVRGEWISDLRSFACVFLAMDGDDAGHQATERWRAFLPESVDLGVPDGSDLRSCGIPVPELVSAAA